MLVKWEWSENAFDLASPGACFERRLALKADGVGLEWTGSVVRTEKAKKAVPPPAELPEKKLLLQDITVDDEWRNVHGQDEVHVIVRHGPTRSVLRWRGQSDAESQSVRALNKVQAGEFVRIDFVYEMSECGSKHACNMSKFVMLGADGIKWAQV